MQAADQIIGRGRNAVKVAEPIAQADIGLGGRIKLGWDIRDDLGHCGSIGSPSWGPW